MWQKLRLTAPCGLNREQDLDQIRDPDPSFISMRIPIRLADPDPSPYQCDANLNHFSTDPPRLHCERPRPPRPHFDRLKPLYFYLNADLYQAYHSNRDPDPNTASQNKADPDPHSAILSVTSVADP
jgi:hypothetical protein